MSEKFFTRMTASLSELKQNPMATVASAEGRPIAIIHENRPAFYCVPANLYEPLPFAQDSNPICRRISCVPIFGLC